MHNIRIQTNFRILGNNLQKRISRFATIVIYVYLSPLKSYLVAGFFPFVLFFKRKVLKQTSVGAGNGGCLTVDQNLHITFVHT